jgi:Peptidase family M23
MRLSRGAVVRALIATAVAAGGAVPAAASAGMGGGVQAPSAPQAGGSEYGIAVRAVPRERPVISALHVPASATAGPPPKVTLRLDEQGVGTVYVQVKVINLATHHSSVVATMGWSHTGRTLTVAWPASAQLAAGSYELSVNAHDHTGGTLQRRAHSSGETGLKVTEPPAPKPAPVTPPATALPVAGAPSPAQTVADGAVFPVAGAHNFGGPENRFGAGYYAVEHTGVGFDFMFAHCEANSLVVSAGQAVAAGQALCKAGQTGDATAPHLHFEMWVGGWQAKGGEPVDPLPYLEAWEAG